MSSSRSLASVLLLAALAGAARADECVRLVEALGPITYGKGSHRVSFVPPTTAGTWFLTVDRDGPAPGRVELNGRDVVSPSDLAGPANRHVRVPVTLLAGNALRVVVQGQTQLTVAVVGLVPAADLPAGVGRRVGRVTLFERTFGPGLQSLTVPAPATEGLFDLRARAGHPRPILGALLWNDEPVLGLVALHPGRTFAVGPVRVQASNRLTTLVLGLRGPTMTVTLDGHAVDEVAPEAAWTAPAPDALLRPDDALVLAFSDALTGIASVRVELDGVDVTSSFDVGANDARSTLARVGAGHGAHLLRAIVRDRACGETETTVPFRVDLQPPTLALEPADGSVLDTRDVPLRATWSDDLSGVDVDGFVARVDGEERTGSFVRGPEGATATLRLEPGEHVLEVAIRDLAGNEATATSRFEVRDDVVDHLELTIGPPRGPAPDEGALLTLAPGAGRAPDGGDDDPTAAPGARLLRDALTSAYADGVSAPAGPDRPSARAVSNALFEQSASLPDARRATDYLWMWGQLVSHDLALSRAHDPVEPLPIPVPATDEELDPSWSGTVALPFNRSRHDPTSSPREQTNEVSAWLDGSGLYADAARANQNLGLLALHTVFVREHDRLVGLLRARWAEATDEELHRSARRIVVAELQAITYQEFLPALLGPDALAPSAGYDQDLQVGIDNAFATAAFRVGHSLLSPQLLRLDALGRPIAEGPIALRDAFFAPQRLTEGGGIEPLLRGAAAQVCQALDPFVVDDVRTYLFGAPGQGGLDLAALDLQRGRDHGLPSYNEARRQLGLAPRTSFAEVTADPELQARLARAYANVDDVDLLAGGLCEPPVEGSHVGELFQRLISRQFELLRDGDRHFYTREFSGPALEALQRTRLSDVIRRNTTIGAELQDDVFSGPLEPFTENDLSVRAVTRSGATATTFTGFVTVSVSDGKPPLDGFLFELTETHQGQATFPGLAFFQTLGPLVITARSLPLDGEPEVSGSLPITVALAAPVVFPALPASVPAGRELTLQGLSFPGQQVELLIDGQLVATEIAGPGGAFTASVRLTPGAHVVVVRSLDPATGQVVSSTTHTVEQVAPPAGGLDVTPSPLSLAVGQRQQLAVHERFVDGTSRDATALAAYASADPSIVTVSPDGLVSAHAVGSTTLSVSLDGFTVVVPVTVGVPILVETSPAQDEDGVAVTRETVLRFSAPLDRDSVTPAAVHADFGDTPLPATPHLSPDGTTLTLFYASPLPPSTRVRVTISGDLLRDTLGNAIDVDLDGQAGGSVALDFDTLTITVVPGTVAFGRVFSSRLARGYDMADHGDGAPDYVHEGEDGAVYGPPLESGDVGSVSIPLAGARISVVGAEETLFTFTDSTGSFRLDPSPAGTFFVHVEVVDPDRALHYPDIGKPWTTLAGEETFVGDIYLPIIADGVLQPVSDTQDVTIGFIDEITQQFPHLAGTQITVPAGSLYSTDGSTEPKRVGLAPVAPDRLPAPLPDGLEFDVVFTIQTSGGTNFDVPAPVRFPNRRQLPPGAKSALWSFNHDTGEWEVIGGMTVSADGLWVETDPGVGVLAPGWHGDQAGCQGEGGGSRDGGGRRKGRVPDTGNDQETKDGDGNPKEPCNVYLHNGEEYFDRVDLSIPGRGDIHFSMQRRYRSRITYDGPLGHNWDFTYDEHLSIEPNGDVVRVDGESHVARWTRLPDGSFTSPSGFFGTLQQTADGEYVLREPDGFQRRYASDGYLVSHVDRFGNRMDFWHDEHGDLDLLVDAYGREVEFTFTTFADGQRRLTSIRDFVGREVLYSYDQQGDLREVRSPIVVGTSTGNDFPAGRTERYTYTSGFADERLNHNIETLTFPQEVASGGPPAFHWTYGTDPADAATFDRVVERVRGGTNASGVPAGGTARFIYTELDDGPVRRRTRVIERNGNVREHDFDASNNEVAVRTFTRGLREGEPAFYETRSSYDSDGQLVRRVFPEGNELLLTYSSGPRGARRNLVESRLVAGPRGADGLGAPAEDIVTTFTYEPLYNRLASVTDPRGNSPTYAPPLGENTPGRYTTRIFYDYQEHDDPVPQAVELGLDLSSAARGLGDLNGDGRTDQAYGNPVRHVAPSVLLEEGSPQAVLRGTTTQAVATETWWNDRGQTIRTIDPEGNVTTFDHATEHDPDGDGQLTPSMVRTLTETPTGYLRAVTVDAATSPRRTFQGPPAALTTVYRRDPVGNVVAVTNPRGVTTELEVNALDEVVVVTRGAAIAQALLLGELPPSDAPLRYRARTAYDHNGRRIAVEVENRDGTTEGVGPFVERTFVYDILHMPVEITDEVDATTRLTTRLRYDGNQNLVGTTAPEGNTVATTYDERDLVHTLTRGAGTALAATTTIDYDGNGNAVRIGDAEDTDGDGAREAATIRFDGFDRAAEARDALGNRASTTYDVAGQAVRTRAFGHPAGAPASPHVLLRDARVSHDELGRAFRRDAALFVASGSSTLRPVVLSDHDGDGLVTTRVAYDALSRVTFSIEDDLQVTRTAYDGVGRVIERADALGNRLLTSHDRGGNAIAVTSVEVSPEGLVPAETFTTRYVYDQLDRLVRATDAVGQTSRFSFDSRDNLVLRSDPEGPLTADPLGLFPGAINGPGNTCRYVHDGLGRTIRQVSDLRVGGTGAGALDTSNPHNRDGQVALGYAFDGNSRLVGIVDDNGNRTSFGYDALDRKVSHTFADGESFTYAYDRDGNLRSVTDPNGSVTTRIYDALNRVVELAVARGPFVQGTTRQTFAYDGLSRLVQATDDNGDPATSLQTVQYVHDSLGRLLEERQNGRAISSRYTGDGKRTQVTYPGGRTIARTFDAIDRIKELRDGSATLASSDWIGPGLRELRRRNGNGTTLTFLSDAADADVGYDAVQRLVRLRVLAPDGAPFVDREYGYNRASQRTFERRSDDAGLTDHYTYDSAYRIVASAYDQEGLTGASRRDLQSASYVMDGVGNRRTVSKQTAVGPVTDTYTPNAVNEYTSVAGVARANDDNGNLTDDGARLFFHDASNRLVAVTDKATARPIARYAYLPDGRRSSKTVFSPAGQVQKVTAFFSDGAQEVEEQDAGSGATETTYVWSPVYIDGLVGYSNSLGTFYTHQDARADVVAITDASGQVVERVRYDDFGRAEVVGRAQSAVGNVHGFQGRRLDPETGLLYLRARYYDPETGRFLQRDPVWDVGNVGGQYTFVGNGPMSRRDPSGLNSKEVEELRRKFAIEPTELNRSKLVNAYLRGGNEAIGNVEDVRNLRNLLWKLDENAEKIKTGRGQRARNILLEERDKLKKAVKSLADRSPEARATLIGMARNPAIKLPKGLRGFVIGGLAAAGILLLSGDPAMAGEIAVEGIAPTSKEVAETSGTKGADYAGAVAWDILSTVDPTPDAQATGIVGDAIDFSTGYREPKPLHEKSLWDLAKFMFKASIPIVGPMFASAQATREGLEHAWWYSKQPDSSCASADPED